MLSKVIFFTALLASALIVQGKVYDRCEFAKALKAQGVPSDQIPTFVCIANHQSLLKTDAFNADSKSYGILQITSGVWCKDGSCPGSVCNMGCKTFLDDDITNDIICAKIIYKKTEEQGVKPGFKQWGPGYNGVCENNVAKFTEGCNL